RLLRGGVGRVDFAVCQHAAVGRGFFQADLEAPQPAQVFHDLLGVFAGQRPAAGLQVAQHQRTIGLAAIANDLDVGTLVVADVLRGQQFTDFAIAVVGVDGGHFQIGVGLVVGDGKEI